MKTLRVSEGAHRELTRLLGEIIAESGGTKMYSDVIEALLSRTVYLPPETFGEMKKLAKSGLHLTARHSKSLFKKP